MKPALFILMIALIFEWGLMTNFHVECSRRDIISRKDKVRYAITSVIMWIIILADAYLVFAK